MQGKNNKNKKNNKYLALYIFNPVIYGVMRNENKKGSKKMENYYATCPACEYEFLSMNNMDVSCPECETEFVTCCDELLTLWD